MKNMDTDKLRQKAEQIHLTEEQKKNIVENCMKHAGKFPDTGTVTENQHIFEVERVKPRPIRRIMAGIAACAVLAAGIGVSGHYISRSGLPGDATEPATEMTEPAENIVPFGDISAYRFMGDAFSSDGVPEGGIALTEKQAAKLNEFFRSQTWKMIHNYNTGYKGWDPDFDRSLLGAVPMIDEYDCIFRSQDENSWYGQLEFSSEGYLEYRRPDAANNSEIVEIYTIDAQAFRDAFDALYADTESGSAEDIQLVSVLDVTGRTAEDAVILLEYKSFSSKIVYVAGEQKGIVVSTEPKAGEKCPVGSEVILYVANGSETDEEHGYPFPAFTDFSYRETVCFFDSPDAEKGAALDELFRSLSWEKTYDYSYTMENEYENAINSPVWDDPARFSNEEVLTYNFRLENKELGTTLVSVFSDNGGYVTVTDKNGVREYHTDFDKLVRGIGEILFGEGLYGEDAPFGNYSGQTIYGSYSRFAQPTFEITDPEDIRFIEMMKGLYWETAEDGYTGTEKHIGFGEFELYYIIDGNAYSLLVYDNDFARWAVIDDAHSNDPENIHETLLKVNSQTMMRYFSLITDLNPYPPFGSFNKIGAVTVNGEYLLADPDKLDRLTQLFYGYNWNETVPLDLDGDAEYEFTYEVNDRMRHVLVFSDGRVQWYDDTPDSVDSGCLQTYSPSTVSICYTIYEILG